MVLIYSVIFIFILSQRRKAREGFTLSFHTTFLQNSSFGAKTLIQEKYTHQEEMKFFEWCRSRLRGKCKKVSWLLSSLFLLNSSCLHQKSRNLQAQDKKKQVRILTLGQLEVMDKAKEKTWHLTITQTDKARKNIEGDEQIRKEIQKTVVAVIDTGIDLEHPDFKGSLWVNQAELHGKKGVDDDQNGFVDDLHGWNFADQNNNVSDQHGHGTHVAGIIGGLGKKCPPGGIAPQVKLMVLKYYNPKASGQVNLNNTVAAINYAVSNGAHIINFSGGGEESSDKEASAINRANEKSILFVTAGGNEHSDISKKPYYPASYDFPNIFSVGSTNQLDEHSHFSNRGQVIDAHAPGAKIYSTLNFGRCGFLTGTSQATPIFTGGAVLVRVNKSLQKPSEIIEELKKTVDSVGNKLKGKSESGGRANLYEATLSRDFGKTINNQKIIETAPDIAIYIDPGLSSYKETSEVSPSDDLPQSVKEDMEEKKSALGFEELISESPSIEKKRSPASVKNTPTTPSFFRKFFASPSQN